MLTGGDQSELKLNKNDISTIKNLFSNILNEKTSVKFDKYIWQSFAAFTQKKKTNCFGFT